MRIPVFSAAQTGGMTATRSGACRPGRSVATLGISYLSHDGGGVKLARPFRIEPPVSVT
jgi:hypothetical protein